MKLARLFGAVALGSVLVGCPGAESGSAPPPTGASTDASAPAPDQAKPADPNPPATPPAGVSKTDGGWVHDKTGIELVWVPPGTFRMGDDANEKARPAREVTLSKGFFLGKTEVTLGQYRAYCKEAGATPPEKAAELGDDHPAVFVSWDDAQAFCTWAGLRLPTEAEWEWAARGTDGRGFPWGDDEPGTTRANIKGAEDGHEKTAPVGSFPPGASPVGALDMAGNAAEWCQDWYADGYPEGAATDPTGPGSGQFRVFRGGSHTMPAERAKATDHAGVGPSRGVVYIGFRAALTP